MQQRMDQEFSLRGVWWLPETPDRKVEGELVFSQASAPQLTLTGNGPFLADRGRPYSFEVRIRSSERLSTEFLSALPFAKFSKHITTFRGIAIFIRVSTIFLGKHFPPADSMRFLTLSVHFAYVEEWAGLKITTPPLEVVQLNPEGDISDVRESYN